MGTFKGKYPSRTLKVFGIVLFLYASLIIPISCSQDWNKYNGNYSYDSHITKSPKKPGDNDKQIPLSSTSHVNSVHKDLSFKSPNKRSGIGIEKGPPDLQFGLAFTVPFVSLATDKLLSTVSGHRGYDSIWDALSILKVNVGGIALAAVIGIGAIIILPLVFGGKLGGLFGNHGGGGWGGPSFGGFVPGFLDSIMPGLGISKPLGYGQTYDHTTYPYHSDNYGAYSQRKEQQGKSRALNGDNSANATKPSFWGRVFEEVHKTVGQFESCALHAMCERGKNSTFGTSSTGTPGPGPGRGNRKLEDSSGKHGSNSNDKLSSVEHLLEAIHGIGSQNLPGIDQIQKAYKKGVNGENCDKFYKKCPITVTQVNEIMKNVGEYVFN